MTTIHLITGLGPGGTEKFLLEYLKYKNEKQNIVVLAGRGFYSEEFERLAKSVTYLNLNNFNLFSVVKLTLKLRKCERIRIICWLGHAQILGGVLSLFHKNAKLKFMYRQSIAEKNTLRLGEKFVLFLVVFFSRFADRNIFNSYLGKKKFQELGVDEKNSLVLHNGVNKKKFSFDINIRAKVRNRLGIKDGEFLVLWVGRWHHDKGTDLAFDIAYAACTEDRKLKFCFVGAKDDSLILSGTEKHKHPNILIHDVVQHIEDFYNAADLLYVTSRMEGCPNVVLEGCANSLPIISTDVGDVGYFLGDNNLLPFGAVDQFVKRIKEIKENGCERTNYKKLSTDKIYSANGCFAKLDKYLQEE